MLLLYFTSTLPGAPNGLWTLMLEKRTKTKKEGEKNPKITSPTLVDQKTEPV